MGVGGRRLRRNLQDFSATCGEPTDGVTDAHACSESTDTAADAGTACPEAGCDDATCCVAASTFSATCGEPTDGATDAHACSESTDTAADAGTACPEAGCDDATCCEAAAAAPIHKYFCECETEASVADVNTDVPVYEENCTDDVDECTADVVTTDEPEMGMASAVHVSAVVLMVFSFLW